MCSFRYAYNTVVVFIRKLTVNPSNLFLISELYEILKALVSDIHLEQGKNTNRRLFMDTKIQFIFSHVVQVYVLYSITYGI